VSALLKRLYNIARTFGPKRQTDSGDWLDQDTQTDPSDSGDPHQNSRRSFSPGMNDKLPDNDFPARIIEDLANFNLSPPASLEAVRQARNMEFKKYHPDKHHGDPEKAETAKQIMQIYNASYERLKEFYKTR
jgi:DnaJ-domain-containing protein 1